MDFKVSCLVDTNILIQFEEEDQGTGLFRKEFTDVFQLCQKHSVQLFYHPSSIDDIKRDKDLVRQRRTLSAMNKYVKLDNPPTTTIDKLEDIFSVINKENDKVDCLILYALHQGCIDFVISEDTGLHRRGAGQRANLKNRIFSIGEFKNWLLKNYEPHSVELPTVSDLPVYSLDFNDTIFESIRNSYGVEGFNDWVNKCKRQKRRAWVIFEEEKIAAICIYNLDNEFVKEVPEMGSKSLKLCTFKVADGQRGMKLGELLLKTVFIYCTANNLTSTWLTAFGGEQVHLITFLKDFGFIVGAIQNKNKEDILYKNFIVPADLPQMNAFKFHVLYSPLFLDFPEVEKYIIPIVPEYHELLFPELVEPSETQLSFIPELKETKIPGNTIKKVYICHSPTKTMKEGSIIFFYRSKDKKSLTTIGVVEATHRLNTFSTLIRIIGKRSVYSLEEIKSMLSKEILLIEFRLASHLNEAVKYEFLVKNEILKGPPMSIPRYLMKPI